MRWSKAMSILFMDFQTSWLWGLIITHITGIFYAQVLGIYMKLKITSCRWFVLTKWTGVRNTLMFHLDVSSQASMVRGTKLKLFTIISSSFVFWVYMDFHSCLNLGTVITLVTVEHFITILKIILIPALCSIFCHSYHAIFKVSIK